MYLYYIAALYLTRTHKHSIRWELLKIVVSG